MKPPKSPVPVDQVPVPGTGGSPSQIVKPFGNPTSAITEIPRSRGGRM